MSMLVTTCPRCASKDMTFDVLAQVYQPPEYPSKKNYYETFCQCRNCRKATIFVILLKNNVTSEVDFKVHPTALVTQHSSLNNWFSVEGYINLRDNLARKPPEHLPKNIEDAFTEGVTCFSVGCYN